MLKRIVSWFCLALFVICTIFVIAAIFTSISQWEEYGATGIVSVIMVSVLDACLFALYRISKKDIQKQKPETAKPASANKKPDEPKQVIVKAEPEEKMQEKPIDEKTAVAQQERPKATHKIQDYKFNVAGISFREEDIMQNLLEENIDFEMTKKEIVDAGMDDERIYQYDYWTDKVKMVDEPDNEYDPKAIAIYADDIKIGYVKKGSTGRIRNLLKKDVTQISITIQGGKYKYVKYDWEEDSYDMFRDSVPIFARLTIDVREPIKESDEQ